MKLSKDQIQQVEDYLNKKGLKYIDVRYEVLDHMVTDIEHLMNSKNLSIKEASDLVFLKWNKSFYPSSNVWIGLAYSGPKIFIDNCVKIMKKSIIKIFFISFVFAIIVDYTLKNFILNKFVFNKEVSYILFTVIIVNCILIFYWLLQINRTKLQTSYSYLFTRNILPNLLILLFGLLSDIDNPNLMSRPVILIFVFSSWSGWLLYKNHMNSVSNYSLLAKL